MVTYWLVGEKYSNPHRVHQSQQRLSNNSNGSFNPKSSLRCSKPSPSGDASASILDSPKKLRFAMDDPVDGGGGALVAAKRNSCPNLPDFRPEGGLGPPDPLAGHLGGGNSASEIHQLAGASTDATAAAAAGRADRPVNSQRQRRRKAHQHAPKIELSPPEESVPVTATIVSGGGDFWPLLDPRYVDECDRETCV